jgi:hypothetical protein
LFTVVYSLIGIVFVFAALSPLVDALKAVNSFILSPCAPIEKNDYDSLEELKLNGNWGFKYSKAGMGLFLTFSIGLLIGFFVMQLSLVNCVYWSMITMTTIGYGDISGHSAIERLFLIVYLPLAVAALADTLGVVSKISTARDLIETDFAKRADELLLGEAGGEDPNPDETLTEAEFLISVLKSKRLVRRGAARRGAPRARADRVDRRRSVDQLLLRPQLCGVDAHHGRADARTRVPAVALLRRGVGQRAALEAVRAGDLECHHFCDL